MKGVNEKQSMSTKRRPHKMEGLKLAKGGQRGNGKQGESHVMCVSKFELLPKSTARHEVSFTRACPPRLSFYMPRVSTPQLSLLYAKLKLKLLNAESYKYFSLNFVLDV